MITAYCNIWKNLDHHDHGGSVKRSAIFGIGLCFTVADAAVQVV